MRPVIILFEDAHLSFLYNAVTSIFPMWRFLMTSASPKRGYNIVGVVGRVDGSFFSISSRLVAPMNPRPITRTLPATRSDAMTHVAIEYHGIRSTPWVVNGPTNTAASSPSQCIAFYTLASLSFTLTTYIHTYIRITSTCVLCSRDLRSSAHPAVLVLPLSLNGWVVFLKWLQINYRSAG